MSRAPIWVLLIPAAPGWLEERGLEVWREQELPGVPTVVAGTGDYSALVANDPDLTDTELPFAEALAREVDGAIWATRPIDMSELGDEGAVVWRVERDQATETIARDPFELAEELGCPLRPTSVVPPHQVRTVALVDGVDVETVRAAWGDEAGWYVFERAGNGTLVRTPAAGAVDTTTLRYALPDATVYRVLRGPTPERFAVHVQRGPETVGAFELDGTRLPGVPALDDIHGERSPADILRALGIAPALLGY